MQISEQELRTMIRDAIARNTGARPALEVSSAPLPEVAGTIRAHASHVLFLVEGSTDGECVIEANRPCDHCGYCKSLGH